MFRFQSSRMLFHRKFGVKGDFFRLLFSSNVSLQKLFQGCWRLCCLARVSAALHEGTFINYTNFRSVMTAKMLHL